jgi:hypothetical protein
MISVLTIPTQKIIMMIIIKILEENFSR